jgi:hypothetical protein
MLRRLIPLYPLLAAAAPVLMLGAANIDQITAAALGWPLAISVAATALLLASLWAVGRDGEKAALTATVTVAVFFGYGHLFEAIASALDYSQRRPLNALLTAAALALAAAVACVIWRTRRSLQRPTQFAGLTALFLVGFGTWNLVDAYRDHQKTARRASRAAARRNEVSATQVQAVADADALPKAPCDRVPLAERVAPLDEDSADRPDIYYIIPDGYGRADRLQEIYGHDNSEFLDGLRRRGFYVADQSCANYPMTFLSLASSLNLRYINDDLEQIGVRSGRRRPVYRMIHDHAVGRYLQAKGYRCLHIASNWGGTERSEVADVTYQPGSAFLQQEFVGVLLRSTLLHPWAPHVAHTHLFAFDKLEEIPRIAGPTFTFVHVVVPHNPYVLDRDGNIRSDVALSMQFDKDNNTGGWANLEGYTEQVRFVNKRITEVIDTLQSRSPHPPVIIVQADHGTATRKQDGVAVAKQTDFILERMPILNAYYVPDACRRLLYPEISPVNSFRVLFNSLFDDHLELLPDRQFFSWYGQPYKLHDVTHLFQPPVKVVLSLRERRSSRGAR